MTRNTDTHLRDKTHIWYKETEQARRGFFVATPQSSHQQIGDFYVEVVLPALAARLDAAFPEFGWRQDARGWVATNQEMTHRVFGVRADRVVAHGHAPQGFLIHGADPTLWTAYLNGGAIPRGETFRTVVHELAARAGVDTSHIDRSQPARPSERPSTRLLQALRTRVSRRVRRCGAFVPGGTRLSRRERRPSRIRGRSWRALHQECPPGGGLLGTRDRPIRADRGWPLARTPLRRMARRARNHRNLLGAFAPGLGLLDTLSLPSRRESLGAFALRLVRTASFGRRRNDANWCSSRG